MPPGTGSTPSTRLGVSPLYFAGDDALFGLYHAPQARADRETGIVVCNPFGREYLYAHRALRHVAQRLADRGFHVLRFDYFGTGDSAGEGTEGGLGRWARDVGTAVDELRDRAGLSRVALVGLRLGASLAWLGAVGRRDVEALALWEPVASGAAHLGLLEEHDRRWRLERRLPGEDPQGSAILGFPVTPGLRADLGSLDIPAEGQRPARHLLLVRHDAPASDDPFTRALAARGSGAEIAHCPSPPFWLRDGDGPAVVVPGPPVQRILDWLEQTLP